MGKKMLNDIILAFAISPDEPMKCDEVAKVIGEEDYNYVEHQMMELIINDGPLIRLHELEGGYGLYKINPDNKKSKFHLEMVNWWTNVKSSIIQQQDGSVGNSSSVVSELA